MYDAVGWQVAVLLLAAFSLLPLPLILGWQEGASTSGLPEPRATLRSALAFFSRSAVHWWCLALIPAYTLGFTMAYSLVRPILVDAGWDEGRIGLVVVIGGSGVGEQRLRGDRDASQLLVSGTVSGLNRHALDQCRDRAGESGDIGRLGQFALRDCVRDAPTQAIEGVISFRPADRRSGLGALSGCELAG